MRNVRHLAGVCVTLAVLSVMTAFYLAPAPTKAKEQCTSVEEAIAVIEARSGQVLRVLVDQEAHRWLEVINSEPPQTDLKGERIMVAQMPGVPMFVAFVINGSRTCGSFYVGPSLMLKAIEVARGQMV